MEQLKAAEHARRVAQRALMAYTEKPSNQQNLDLHRRLAAEAKSAAETYVTTAIALDSR
jgi:hypothetical protein